MPSLASEFPGIVGALLVFFAGVLSVAIAVSRLRSGDLSLMSFGLFSLVYGFRWLTESEVLRALFGAPFNDPYLHALLTYIVVIPVMIFLLVVFGRGLFSSYVWMAWSAVVYAVGSIAVDAFAGTTFADAGIHPILVIVWCAVGMVNLVLDRRPERTDLLVVRTVIFLLFLAVANDNLVNMGVFPWDVRVEHFDIIVFCSGLGYVAVRHFLSTEKKLISIEQEVEIARRIQRSNLPADLGSPDGLDIAARFVPMSAVAGDLYDIQGDDKGGIGILIADVSGHGIGAALIGSMLKVAFAAQTKHLSDPARLMAELNRVLRGKTEQSFLTACYVFVDAKRRELSYTNAGHPAPFHWRTSKRTMRRLSTGGTILGPFDDPVYTSERVKISKGDRLVLYTDGIVEMRDRKDEEFGEGRLEAFIAGTAADSPEGAADRLLEELTQWSGRSGEGSYEDDLTLMVVDVGKRDMSRGGSLRSLRTGSHVIVASL